MSKQHALYRFYDQDDQLLYVGISLNPGNRWKQHAADKEWWVNVSNITIEACESREDALTRERRAIETEQPAHNVTYSVETCIFCPRLLPDYSNGNACDSCQQLAFESFMEGSQFGEKLGRSKGYTEGVEQGFKNAERFDNDYPVPDSWSAYDGSGRAV